MLCYDLDLMDHDDDDGSFKLSKWMDMTIYCILFYQYTCLFTDGKERKKGARVV